MTTIRTDYLVVGAGATGMAFTDSVITHSDADVVIVDRRDRPGGHWNDAYPFVRLHQPSAYYGVNSRPLGADAIDPHGPNAGLYERAGGAAVRDYFDRVLDEQLIPSGRVRFLGMHDYERDAEGRHRVVSRLTGAVHEITVDRSVVDAAYLRPNIPATHTPAFHVDAGVRIVPVNGLAAQGEPSAAYTVLGAGKTAMDACQWLLEHGVDPDRIRWIRPRDGWLYDRAHMQPLGLLPSLMNALSHELESLAHADSVEDLFRRLERSGRLLRLDPQVTPTMFHCATVSQRELADLRRIRDVVRLGRVRRIERDKVVLEHGSIPSDDGHLYVDCTASGLGRAPAKPIFEADRITPQMVRGCQPTFNAALVGYVEATRDDVDDKNRLCPVNPLPDAARDWLRLLAMDVAVTRTWAGEPDLKKWLEESRLNIMRGARSHAEDPLMRQAVERRQRFAEPGLRRLHELLHGAE
ncbi:hypothetical protein Val02_30270 [Virgisporangium aliadipatigenens]|uniref:NAD(P)/FAD-dependent oxidoreductase n=1 Tax=Virgisporangium aliadipatigenens TaxID=741659 RepID=A0A8J3YJ97_9ACTN|nr:NAD(P)-binding protein [Virgisporangium aliadipatigenens]GIJ46141.1 hypothetical protein Val02_30270 [Virgisporangium aliadipatigenens]